MNDIDSLLRGSIDMHIHFGPDPLAERRLDALEVARQARDVGMRGIILKSHDYCTAPTAHLVGRLVPEVSVWGSLSLDAGSGGLNVSAVEVAAKLGAKVIWMPTFSAANSLAKAPGGLSVVPRAAAISLLDSKGQLAPAVPEILEVIREHDMILASGHISPRETFALVEEARRVGVGRIVITHPLAAGLSAEAFTLADAQRLAQQGAFIEHCLLGLMPTGHGTDPREMVKAIRALGAEHCIMSTDFGQAYSPLPTEGMRLFIAAMLRHGLNAQEVEFMVKANPARLLGLA